MIKRAVKNENASEIIKVCSAYLLETVVRRLRRYYSQPMRASRTSSNCQNPLLKSRGSANTREYPKVSKCFDCFLPTMVKFPKTLKLLLLIKTRIGRCKIEKKRRTHTLYVILKNTQMGNRKRFHKDQFYSIVSSDLLNVRLVLIVNFTGKCDVI
jgi:hypothetical protein